MACLKCGSSWTTRNGKDMVSCPECCKQQRCKARKQGRLPASATKVCEQCGQQFEAVNAIAMAKSRRCNECRTTARAEWKRQHNRCVSSKKRIAKSKEKRAPIQCSWCGKETKDPNQRKYCSRRCFGDARKAGAHTWDRTGQLESVWHRGGRWACAPSRKPMQEMIKNFGVFLAKVRKLYAKAADHGPACEVCSQPCRTGSRFCSLRCMGQNTVEVPCKKCGKPALARGAFRSAACSDCQRQAKTEENRRAKQKYGRNHRQRARHHGVKYVAFPVRDIYERDGYRCQLCGKAVLPKAAYRKRDGKIHPRSPTIDHIVPMCRGGNHEPGNCQTACFRCNSLKSDRGGGQLRLAIPPIPPGRGTADLAGTSEEIQTFHPA